MNMKCCDHIMSISGRSSIDTETRRHINYTCVKCGLTNCFEEFRLINDLNAPEITNIYREQFPHGCPSELLISVEKVITPSDGKRLYRQAVDLTQSDDNELLSKTILSIIEQENLDKQVSARMKIRTQGY